jgi:hypothetical protein
LINFELFGLSDLEKSKPNQRTKTELVKIFNQIEIFKPKNRTKYSKIYQFILKSIKLICLHTPRFIDIFSVMTVISKLNCFVILIAHHGISMQDLLAALRFYYPYNIYQLIARYLSHNRYLILGPGAGNRTFSRYGSFPLLLIGSQFFLLNPKYIRSLI